MTATTKLLNGVRKKLPNKSDYAVAAAVGISRSRMSHYMTERNQMQEESVIIKAAKLAGMNAALVYAQINVESSTTPEAKALWKSLLELAKTASESVIV